MTTPAFGFSFGDFVTLISLISDIRKALQESGGAKDEIQAVLIDVAQLKSLLTHLSDDAWGHGVDVTHVNAVRGLALTSQVPLREFLAKIRKYRDVGLGGMHGLKRTVNEVRKVQWAVGMKEEISNFRTVIVYKVVTINTLLMVYV